MNRLEFNKVIKAMDINNVVTIRKGKFGSVESVHCWEDVYINFGGSYYANVNGRIPLDIVKSIYYKYPKNPYSIRISSEQGVSNGLFVDSLQVDTKEGLVVLLSEIADYNANKKGKPAIFADKFDELMTTINLEMLGEVKNFISSKARSFDILNVRNIGDATFAHELSVALDIFDRTVNPFQDNSIVFREVDEYLKNISIGADVDMDDHQTVKIFITDLATRNETRFQCGCNSFSYQVRYQDLDGQQFSFLHYYDGDEEIIVVDDSVNNFVMKYDLLTGRLVDGICAEVEPTMDQQELILNSVLRAVGYAASITIDNMVKIDTNKIHKKCMV